MQEYSSPSVVQLGPGAALTDAVVERAQTQPDEVALLRKVDGAWVAVTAGEFARQVQALAAGLVAAGVAAGDRVGLMSRTRYEWTLCDYAIWTAGAVTVPIYETSSAGQVQWNLADSGAVAVVVESAAHQALLAGARDDLPALSRVWQIEAGDLDRLAADGAGTTSAELAARRATLTPDSLATIIYTSGTTGRPKGCELTHASLLQTARTAGVVLPELFREGGTTLLFLPLAHVLARFIQVACLETSTRLGHTADIPNLGLDLAAFQPTFIVGVPRIFEKVYNTARQRAHTSGRGAVFDRAEATAVAYSQAVSLGRPSVLLRARHALFDRLVYARLRAALGGRAGWAVSGGAPLGARLGHFFRGAGITVLEGYGLTETTATGSVNTATDLRIGSVGRPSPGVSIRITPEGEIVVAGDHLLRGYWNNPQATGQSVVDGWFHTGDIGALDDDGYLTITGRLKELIVTAGGKNVPPAVLEDLLRAHPLISQCMVVGDRRPFIGCLITLDPDALAPWAAAHGRPAAAASLTTDPQLLAELQLAVDSANASVSRAEAIRRFRVLPADWTEEGGQLTPSLKLRRSAVLAEFGADVEALYA